MLLLHSNSARTEATFPFMITKYFSGVVTPSHSLPLMVWYREIGIFVTIPLYTISFNSNTAAPAELQFYADRLFCLGRVCTFDSIIWNPFSYY